MLQDGLNPPRHLPFPAIKLSFRHGGLDVSSVSSAPQMSKHCPGAVSPIQCMLEHSPGRAFKDPTTDGRPVGLPTQSLVKAYNDVDASSQHFDAIAESAIRVAQCPPDQSLAFDLFGVAHAAQTPHVEEWEYVFGASPPLPRFRPSLPSTVSSVLMTAIIGAKVQGDISQGRG